MLQHFLSDGNVFIRKDVFDTKLCMTGDTINYGEEQDFQKRLLLQYPDEMIWYN